MSDATVLTPPVTIMSPPASSSSNSSVTSLVHAPDAPQQHDVDPQILEALSSKDRIYVLKLGELMEALISDRTQTRQRIDLSPATTYQRMLVHRCSAFYNLSPETDSVTKAISVVITQESRIPTRRLADIAPPPVETAVKFKIMMRNPRSQPGSVTGDDGDVSDVEASETGSLGGRSSASTSKHRRTIEERTAAYNEARSRIFIDFEEKEQKDTISSASSSASLVSGSSTSASDDPGSPATESEWSGPSAAKKQPPHRANSTSSSRSLRSSAPAFMSSNNSSSSSRNSRAPSPAFKYPSLYEPPPAGAPISIAVPPSYDQQQPSHPQHPTPNNNFQGATPQQQQQQMPMYPYPHPQMQQGQHGQPPYFAPYPYFHQPYGPSPAPYAHSPAVTPNGSDPEVYAYHAHPYAWGPPTVYPAQNGTGTPPNPNQQNPNNPNPNANNPNQNQNHAHAHGQQQQNGTSPPPAQPYPGYPGAYPAYAHLLHDATPTAASPPNGIGVGVGVGGINGNGGNYTHAQQQTYYPPPPHHIPMPPYMGPPQQQYEQPQPHRANANANGRG
ncbi:hypothetical protein K438DRAFT_1658440, partial [Mycena galopus ATCC 62051]